ncbi:hypothetical protein GGR52DRAFT_524965 [Hypoxylon sp. FL1284]|nr:hypothetical protein GGR52DRAFT_524965 [Hypoxylon sp. FL1284]
MISNSLRRHSLIFKTFSPYLYEPWLASVRPAFYHTSIVERKAVEFAVRAAGPKTLQSRRYTKYDKSTRIFTTTRPLNMASDEDYMAFLEKANKDPNEGYTKPQSSGGQEFKATDTGVQIPAVIREATKDSFYVSDADEPFVPVYLAWDEAGKGLPDEEEFASLIQHPTPSSADIEIQDPADWDAQGQYKSILDAVRKAGKGNDVRVYRVPKGGVKVEYWVVTTEGKGAKAKLVGAKALAVES